MTEADWEASLILYKLAYLPQHSHVLRVDRIDPGYLHPELKALYDSKLSEYDHACGGEFYLDYRKDQRESKG